MKAKLDFVVAFGVLLETGLRWQWCVLHDDVSANDCRDAFRRAVSALLQGTL